MFSTVQTSPFHVFAMWQLFEQISPPQAPFAVGSFISFCPMFFFFLIVQLAEAWQEVEVAKSRARQLQDQVEELQEKVSVGGNRGDVSLLSELEISLEAADLGVSKEQVSRSLLRTFLTPDTEQI